MCARNKQYLPACTWTAYHLSTRCRWRGRQLLSPHEPVCENAKRQRLLVISVNEWRLCACWLVHHRSPIEGSVRLMLEHLIEIFQGFHLSCCLKDKHKYQILSLFIIWEHLFSGIKQAEKSQCIVTLVSESRLVTVGSERISAKQQAFYWVLTSWWDLTVLFSEATRSYL